MGCFTKKELKRSRNNSGAAVFDENKKDFFGQAQKYDRVFDNNGNNGNTKVGNIETTKKDELLALVHQSSAIVDLSNKNDNIQTRIDSIVLIYKTKGGIGDDARKKEIKKIKFKWLYD